MLSPSDQKQLGRHWTRFECELSRVELVLPTGCRIPGQPLDESFSGMGILIADAAGIYAGMQAAVDINGCPMKAIVRAVRTEADGGFVVGLEWLSANSAAKQPAAADKGTVLR
jgi:hypothetical protein